MKLGTNAIQLFLQFFGWFISTDLIWNFSGFKTKLKLAIPLLEPFFPAISVALIFTLIAIHYGKILSLFFASVRFHSYYEKLLEWSDHVNGRKPRAESSYSLSYDASKQIIDVCQRFNIPYPTPIEKVDFKAMSFYGDEKADEERLEIWGIFADDIARCASNKNLHKAQEILMNEDERAKAALTRKKRLNHLTICIVLLTILLVILISMIIKKWDVWVYLFNLTFKAAR